MVHQYYLVERTHSIMKIHIVYSVICDPVFFHFIAAVFTPNSCTHFWAPFQTSVAYLRHTKSIEHYLEQDAILPKRTTAFFTVNVIHIVVIVVAMLRLMSVAEINKTHTHTHDYTLTYKMHIQMGIKLHFEVQSVICTRVWELSFIIYPVQIMHRLITFRLYCLPVLQNTNSTIKYRCICGWAKTHTHTCPESYILHFPFLHYFFFFFFHLN